jgi:hypothetical protein
MRRFVPGTLVPSVRIGTEETTDELTLKANKQESVMKLVTASISLLALSSSLALAQVSSSPGSTSPGSTAPGATAPGSTSPGFSAPGAFSPGSSTIAPPGSTSVAPPGTPPPAGSFAPSPGVPNTAAPGSLPNPFTTGTGSGLGQTPQDLTRRYNPQDLTRPGASNPQDLTTGSGGGSSGSGGSSRVTGGSGGSFQQLPVPSGVPSIIAPER